FQAEDGIRDYKVTGVQTCALPISSGRFVRSPRHHMVERHRDVGAERPLDLRGAHRREGAAAAVYMTLKLLPVVVHPAESLERERSEERRVGKECRSWSSWDA